MYKITELTGKKLIDVNTARDLGTVTGIAWNKQLGSCAIITDDGAFVAEKIFSVMDAVSVVNPERAENHETLDIDKLAYDTTGKYLGKLAEVEFGNSLKLAKAHLNDGTVFSRGKVYAVKDVMLIRAKTPTSAKSATSKNKTGATKSAPAARKLTTAQWLQNRRYGDFSFLIGKTVDKTITNFQGELMIKQGEKVTSTILRQAKVSGKLIELCLHTK